MIEKSAVYTISQGVYLFTMNEPAASSPAVPGAPAPAPAPAPADPSATFPITTALPRPIGRVVDAVSQIASEPLRISVSLMKSGHVAQNVSAGTAFVLTTLAQDADMDLIAAFGMKTSADTDKFAGHDLSHDEAGTPFLRAGALAQMSGKIVDILDMGSHLLLVADVTEAHDFVKESANAGLPWTGSKDPLTYAEYRQLKSAQKGERVRDSSTGSDDAPGTGSTSKFGWRCTICGFVIQADELPDDYTCPRCGVGKECFEKILL